MFACHREARAYTPWEVSLAIKVPAITQGPKLGEQGCTSPYPLSLPPSGMLPCSLMLKGTGLDRPEVGVWIALDKFFFQALKKKRIADVMCNCNSNKPLSFWLCSWRLLEAMQSVWSHGRIPGTLSGVQGPGTCLYVCVRACVHACLDACVRVYVRAYVSACVIIPRRVFYISPIKQVPLFNSKIHPKNVLF